MKTVEYAPRAQDRGGQLLITDAADSGLRGRVTARTKSVEPGVRLRRHIDVVGRSDIQRAVIRVQRRSGADDRACGRVDRFLGLGPLQRHAAADFHLADVGEFDCGLRSDVESLRTLDRRSIAD